MLVRSACGSQLVRDSAVAKCLSTGGLVPVQIKIARLPRATDTHDCIVPHVAEAIRQIHGVDASYISEAMNAGGLPTVTSLTKHKSCLCICLFPAEGVDISSNIRATRRPLYRPFFNASTTIAPTAPASFHRHHDRLACPFDRPPAVDNGRGREVLLSARGPGSQSNG